MKRYPAYKDSGIEWIEQVPKDWQVNRLKTVCTFTYGDSLANEARIEGDVPVYGSNGIVGWHNKAITHKPCIVIGRKGSYGKVNFSQLECFPIDTTYFVDDRSAKCDLKWLKYILPLLELDKFSKDTGVPGLNREDAHNKIVPVPESSVQKVIAGYLDRKTAQVNDLITKKEQMIELLKEERTAIINQAVTKGLDPKAEMKDSDIDGSTSFTTGWLGNVPKHWEMKKIKYLARINSEALSETTEDNYEFNYIDISNVDLEDGFNLSEKIIFVNAPSRARRIVRKGDTIVSTVRTYLKAIAYFERDVRDTIVSTGFAVITPLKKILPRYFYYVLRSEKFIDRVCALSVGVSYPAINSDELSNIDIWYPEEIKEQQKIVEYLDQAVTKTKLIIARLHSEIELLKEYRTALISEVVTGKIDVRGRA